MAKTEISIKRGDTFRIVATYTDPNGVVPDITTLGIRTQIRDAKGTLISEPVITKLDQTDQATRGKYTLRADTDTWPLQTLVWDIEYTINGDVTSTNTFTIVVTPDVTRS